ncbi:Solute carrier family 2, facilitated glucose transporter member 2 [Hondaea fermentalgiana]|uniref:Hexose transporter 1 n=1 Tax=Hondaea fermentalgiana TaxID=2315210 RepID=A0A2R5FYS9_9STRA|nr:Solute carrier family 2, facilitated glucose transporter member 2 [Hondaea fermentalgiana]|eukprot:GBG23916.1 Solute carrier family 2, facilitated glucose transporter member 2 [Hondaea fermentalgiana]
MLAEDNSQTGSGKNKSGQEVSLWTEEDRANETANTKGKALQPAENADTVNGTEQKQEDRAARQLNAFTVLIMCISVLSGLMFGLDIGTAATLSNDYFREQVGIPVLVSGQSDSEETTNQISQFTYVLHLACLVGAPFAGFISDRVGRKPVIVLAAIIFLLGAMWQSLSGLMHPDFAWNSIIIGRACGGLGLGFLLTMAPVYTAELTPPDWRGKAITLFQLSVTIGIFIMAIYNNFMAEITWNWRLGIALQCIPALIVIILTLTVLPESPRWLIQVNRHDEAESALRKLAAGSPRSDEAVSNEMRDIQDEVDLEASAGEGSFLELFQRENLSSLMCGAMIAFSQNVTGVNWLMSYATTLFNTLDFDPFTYDLALKAVNVAFTLLAIPLIDRLGRKFLTVWGTTFTIVAFFLIAVVIVGTGVNVGTTNADATTKGVQIFCVVMIYIFQAAFACTLGPLSWVVPPESFSLRLRGVGMAFCVSMNFFTNIVLGDVGYVRMFSATNLQVVSFVLVGFNVLITWPTVVFLQPETKELGLEDLRKVFAYEKGGNEAKGHGTLRQFVWRNVRQTLQIYTCRKTDIRMGFDRFDHKPAPAVV